ncbi:MAG: deoxyribonuclease V [Acidobacteriota bacterium]|nr:deoxyribonuclease V [Acidobacteriota bacterium]
MPRNLRTARRIATKRNRLSPVWPTDIREAREIQIALAAQVRCIPLASPIRLIAGVDASFSGDRVFAAACLYDFPSLGVVEEAVASRPLTFPYVPGFLSFREGPVVLDVLAALGRKPDLLLIDGQGMAHPRKLGLASHIGVLLGLPSIGCAKSRLIGEFREPGPGRGCRSQLTLNGQTIGAVVRTRTGVRPLFVSPGHLVDIPGSVRFVLRTAPRFRIPEPLRRADALSRAASKS